MEKVKREIIIGERVCMRKRGGKVLGRSTGLVLRGKLDHAYVDGTLGTERNTTRTTRERFDIEA